MPGPTLASIWNLALTHIGQSPIESPTEGSVQTDALNRVWELARRDTLRAFKWAFGTVRRVLALVSNYTPLEFTYAYAYPSNSLKLWRVTYDGAGEDAPSELYKTLYDPDNNQNVIITDIEDAYIEYAYDITDTTKFDAAFVVAVSHRLAAEMAVPLNGDAEMAAVEIVIYNGLISEAKRLSADEKRNTHPSNEKSTYVDARN